MPDQPEAAPPPPPTTLLRSTRFVTGRGIAAVMIAVLVIIPDREIAAKLFKVGLILDNVHQRVLGST